MTAAIIVTMGWIDKHESALCDGGRSGSGVFSEKALQLHGKSLFLGERMTGSLFWCVYAWC